MRTCQSCKHYHMPLHNRILFMDPSLFAVCKNPAISRESVDPVTGKLRQDLVSCGGARAYRKCGPLGELWEQK